MNAAAMWEKDYYAMKRRCERVEQQLARLRADYAGLEEHHKATDEIIADARGQSPENGKALLYNMDQLKQQLAEAKAERDHVKFLCGPDEGGKNVFEREHALKQQLSAATSAAQDWQTEHDKLKVYADGMAQQLEQAVRLVEAMTFGGEVRRSNHFIEALDFLSSPAIAPIRERVRKGNKC